MSDEIVIVRTYMNEAEARIAASVLDANGIHAEVLADNAGGLLPVLSVMFPVRLAVRAEDADLARHILDNPPDVSEDDAGASDE